MESKPSKRSGEIHVIVGPMFAGKTTALLRRVQMETANGRKVAVVKSIKDNRYAIDSVVTHDGVTVPCLALTDLSSLRESMGAEEYDKNPPNQYQMYIQMFSGEISANVDGNIVDDEDQDNVNCFSAHLSQNTSPQPLQGNQQSIKPKLWFLLEDEALISAYMKVHTNSIVGTNQRTRVFWSKIKQVYDESCRNNKDIAMRATDSLKGRWRRIVPSIMKWATCYDEALQRKSKGYNDKDVIREAHNIYEDIVGSKFLLFHAWVMLRKFPKWESIVQRGSMGVPHGCPLLCQQEEVDSSSQIGKSNKRKRMDDSTSHLRPTQEGLSQLFDRPESFKKAKKKEKALMQTQEEDQISEFSAEFEYNSKVGEEDIKFEGKLAECWDWKLKMKQEICKLEMINILLKNSNRTKLEDRMLSKMVDWAENNGLM